MGQGMHLTVELDVVEFDPDVHLPDLQDFNCGDEEWSIEVADWIKGRPGGVLDDIREYHTEVWLYGHQELGFVGFGSLGAMEWAYPSKNSKNKPISIIPNLAVHRKF
jgi:hypothetical protein